MASLTELFEALNTKEALVSTADLASELKASKEGTLKQLTREKEKGNVDGNSQEGWEITDKGRAELEKGEIHPTMLEEGVTPRQQFEAIGRLIGIKEDRIILATDMVWSGDYEDVIWVFNALGREGADLADDLRRVWANAWRAKLHKSIPPELESELTGVSKTVAEVEKGDASSTLGSRAYIIVEDEPVRVGENLGDYSLQDAKDILAIRAVRYRFGGGGQPGGPSSQGAVEKVSDVLTALSPYLNKGSDMDALKEILGDKLALTRQEILSQIPQPQPQPGAPPQAKSFIEQITEFVSVIGNLREAGPVLRTILGLPESPGNPVSTDLDKEITWRKFQGEERRADERQTEIAKTLKVARENIPDGIQAILQTVGELKGGTGAGPGAKAPVPAAEQPLEQVFRCGDCQTEFSPPPGWAGQPLKCPLPACGKVYTKEELLE